MNQNHHKFMDEDANLYRKDLRDYVGNLMCSEIAEGNVGAVVVDDEETEGYSFGGMGWYSILC